MNNYSASAFIRYSSASGLPLLFCSSSSILYAYTKHGPTIAKEQETYNLLGSALANTNKLAFLLDLVRIGVQCSE